MLVIVPALNEEASIRAVVADLLAMPAALDVLVIDDGSSDATSPIASTAGAQVLRLPFNCGIGASVQVGIEFGLRRGYRLFARIDGDGQHDPRTLEELRRPLDAGEADFVVGSRYLEPTGDQSTWARRLGSRWFGWMLYTVGGLKISDPTSGLWMANRRAAHVLFAEHASDYPEVDSLVRLKQAGCVIQERAIAMRPRSGGHSSIGGVRIPYYMLKVTLAVIIGRARPSTRLGEGSFT
jgi:glycosyltransferase involved in cell wall biosynthesis